MSGTLGTLGADGIDPANVAMFGRIAGNPVGTDQLAAMQQLTMPTPGVQPGQMWGGRMVSAPFANMAQGAMTNALGFVGGTEGGGGGGIRAYHGSPYAFDAFDASKIGSGQGAQMYGHGMYFTGNEDVARSYRDQLAQTDYVTSAGGRIPDWVGNSIVRVQDDPYLARGVINGHLQDFQGRLAEEQKVLKTASDPWNVQDRIDNFQSIVDHLGKLRSGEATLLPRGSMYEVNINADPSHFLDWDKPLSEQSPQVQQAIGNAGIRSTVGSDSTGEQIYRQHTVTRGYSIRDNPQSAWRASGANSLDEVLAMVGGDKSRVMRLNTGDPAMVAGALQQAGIPGIRYLDQGSRSAGMGTSNHVVFDPAIIDIIRRYGIAGLIASGLTGAAFGPQQVQAQ